MYFLIAAALVISLIIVTAPAQKAVAQNGDVAAEWEMVDTPTVDGWVLAPESTIIDACYAADGEVGYAIVESYYDECDIEMGYYLLKSDDYCATWDDLNDALEDVIDEADHIDELVRVATDWEDPDFVAVAVWWYDDSAGSNYLHVFFSTDGGDTFEDAGEVEDGFGFSNPGEVADLVVTPETGGDRDIFIGGVVCCPSAALFHCTVTGDSAGAWHDATAYDGWDNVGAPATDIFSGYVTDIIVSPNWALDKTALVITIADMGPYDVYLQCGSFGASEAWNEMSTLGIEAVEIMDDVDLPFWLGMMDYRATARTPVTGSSGCG